MLSDHQRGLELLIKEEQHELWASERNHEENDCGQFRLQSPVCWEKNEEDTKPETHHQKYNWKSKEQTDLQDFRPDESNVPVASTSQAQDGQESQQTTVKFMDHIQADDNRSSFSTSREAAVVQFCSAASDFHCHLCDKPFSSNQFLINHAFHFHSRNADVLCAVCGKTLESTESLIAHINSHKGPKCCHICGKHCNSTTSLKEHVASHAGVKLHCCPLCGKECGRKGDLKIHMRIHTGEKPFCCSYCCKSFTHSGHLKKHLRSHTGERPHRCGVCGKRFLQSTHLKSHMGTHIQKNWRLSSNNSEHHKTGHLQSYMFMSDESGVVKICFKILSFLTGKKWEDWEDINIESLSKPFEGNGLCQHSTPSRSLV